MKHESKKVFCELIRKPTQEFVTINLELVGVREASEWASIITRLYLSWKHETWLID